MAYHQLLHKIYCRHFHGCRPHLPPLLYYHKSDAYLKINLGLAFFMAAPLIVPIMEVVYIKGWRPFKGRPRQGCHDPKHWVGPSKALLTQIRLVQDYNANLEGQQLGLCVSEQYGACISTPAPQSAFLPSTVCLSSVHRFVDCPKSPLYWLLSSIEGIIFEYYVYI
ncbi:hypothetical protein CRG98_013968 [Punica granatum]|uniref:Uncharacterized protein n=1 Tax=Punica granatum TaxID=22663 RepID=A0A2I0KC20_PUNGR|nr:hypothetical protein CRG98_013968 [Punica granatum]